MLLELVPHVCCQVARSVRVAPLVVVPAEHLDGSAVGHGELRVEDARGFVAYDVAGDQRGFRVLQDVRELSISGRPESGVHVVGGGFARDAGDEVRYRAVGDGDAHRHTVDLAFELGVDHTRRPRRACGGGDDVVGGRAGAPRILVGRVQEALVVGIGVNGRHVTGVDAEVVLDHFDHRNNAVGRARSIGDDLVGLGIVVLVVHLVDEGGVDTLARGRDDDLLRPAFDVGCGPVAIRKDARRLDHDVRADVAPGYLGRVPLSEGLDLMVAHVKDVAVEGYVLGPDPVGRVVLEQVSQAIEGHQIVGRHDLEVATLHRGFGEQHPDPAEAIYSYSYGHFSLQSLACCNLVFCPKTRESNISLRAPSDPTTWLSPPAAEGDGSPRSWRGLRDGRAP